MVDVGVQPCLHSRLYTCVTCRVSNYCGQQWEIFLVSRWRWSQCLRLGLHSRPSSVCSTQCKWQWFFSVHHLFPPVVDSAISSTIITKKKSDRFIFVTLLFATERNTSIFVLPNMLILIFEKKIFVVIMSHVLLQIWWSNCCETTVCSHLMVAQYFPSQPHGRRLHRLFVYLSLHPLHNVYQTGELPWQQME